ncbi:MAG: ABC-F family ATP-binding cassette domain-containing protein [Bacteroidota bacterium]|nr:ABC-F family ATP-binding cassette domain-containing protein [Bacteroidota bacterium]
MISLTNITVSFSGKDLFTDVSFQINKQDKIGLVGKNGTGKSTLLKIIIGELSNYSGSLAHSKDITIGYLPQYLAYSDGKSVFEEAFTAFDGFKKLSKELDDYNSQLEQRTDYDSKSYKKLIDKITDLSFKLSLHKESTFVANTEKILKGLGFSDADFSRPTNEFSGGWRMRIEIAKILLREPDALLLDEPTNHLDIESIQWLEEFMKNFGGSIVLISHDRRFLDTVTNRTVEITLGKIFDYPVAYTKFRQMSQERRDQQIAAYENQQNKSRQTEKFIERFRSKATKATQVQSRVKMLEKMDKIEIEADDNATINFRFPEAPRAGDIVIETNELTKQFDEHVVLNEVDFILERGEKIAFVGKNGEGKTTFVRVIIKELEYSGLLKIGHNVSVGYYAQNQDETLDKNKTVFDTLEEIAVGDVRTQLRKILGAFLFRDDDIDKKVAVLSGGERARLALAKMILQPYSLIILDEPTNHLDMLAKEILKKALGLYNGTLIVVSHDRDFLHGLVDTVYEFTNKKIKQYKGGINYFLEKKKIQFIDQISLQKKQKEEKTDKNDIVNESKNDYLIRKEKKKIINKIQRNIQTSEKKIDEMETKIKNLEDEMNNTKHDSEDIFSEYDNLKIELEKEMKKWEDFNEKLEEEKQ